ncbi:DUF3325 domain-containing protein [Roseomonas sp. NAR14]|uniref:DUF3325 domain-containing protein n=1 Tax=Roseomonas acroporae TaxID=2937791 RepID=A0A9X1Y8K9_9PROT|nr:DUF3325 domain-containing protein [Roseomonas acroporae]MCK8784097.1 DUF3325 domain-containing protein [Roseomonas acroporae]
MSFLSLALAYAGFTALCLAMERHHEQVFQARRVPPRRRRALRIAGWLLLAASPVPCILAEGWGYGTVLWCGVLTAAVLPLALLLPYAPRAAALLGPVMLPLAALLAVLRA